MSKNDYRNRISRILATAGVTVNGPNPWDIRIHHPDFYSRVGKKPSLGLGESYMETWWDCAALDEFFYRILTYIKPESIYSAATVLGYLFSHFLTNQQNKWRSKLVAKKHYNLGNKLYRHMLGDNMAYTCGYWKNADNLETAQNAKYDLICRKTQLQAGETVLELGCGWGGFARYAAQHYGVHMVCINIAAEQVQYARRICAELPVTVYQCDYRDIAIYNPKKIRFDKVISIGMCEHVGYKNYPGFLQIARENLKPDGLFLLHTIGKNKTTYFSDPWIEKYIFPGGMLPTIRILAKAAEKHFVVEDLHNFGADYDKTLMAWERNFTTTWPELQNDYDQQFYRMWRYYLLSCAGAFRARDLQLWQWVLSPTGVGNGYFSIR